MRFLKYLLMFAFVAIAIYGITALADQEITVDATAADVTWDGGGADNLASTKENWAGDVYTIMFPTTLVFGSAGIHKPARLIMIPREFFMFDLVILDPSSYLMFTATNGYLIWHLVTFDVYGGMFISIVPMGTVNNLIGGLMLLMPLIRALCRP